MHAMLTGSADSDSAISSSKKFVEILPKNEVRKNSLFTHSLSKLFSNFFEIFFMLNFVFRFSNFVVFFFFSHFLIVFIGEAMSVVFERKNRRAKRHDSAWCETVQSTH
jgi:hypothetical protein